jgi:hypothetical protein
MAGSVSSSCVRYLPTRDGKNSYWLAYEEASCDEDLDMERDLPQSHLESMGTQYSFACAQKDTKRKSGPFCLQ